MIDIFSNYGVIFRMKMFMIPLYSFPFKQGFQALLTNARKRNTLKKGETSLLALNTDTQDLIKENSTLQDSK